LIQEAVVDIIIKKSQQRGETRSRVEKELRKEGWGSSLTDEQIDKCEYAERVIKEYFGADKSFVESRIIDKVK